jgi:hypothetical protein
MPLQVVYIDALGNLARAEFSDVTAARDYASEHAQSCVIHGDPVLDHHIGPKFNVRRTTQGLPGIIYDELPGME